MHFTFERRQLVHAFGLLIVLLFWEGCRDEVVANIVVALVLELLVVTDEVEILGSMEIVMLKKARYEPW